jgi:hypothetical protein
MPVVRKSGTFYAAVGVPVIKALFRRDSWRVVASVRQCIRLGFHPADWKVAKGVCIPKPGKKYYQLAKNYRVISLLSCLGKLIEKVTATLITNDAERRSVLHEGQFGGRWKRSAMDAAGVVVATVDEAWEQGDIAAALMMDVKRAFPTVNCECLVHKMRLAKTDANLIQSTASFMANRKVEIIINGENGEAIETNTGLAQGSPVPKTLQTLSLPKFKPCLRNAKWTDPTNTPLKLISGAVVSMGRTLMKM